MKQRFMVRRVQQADHNSASECFESYHYSINDASNEFDINSFVSNMKAIFGEKVTIQLFIT